ncbi:MurR/RpiR family transcriptional regulator [Pseudaminobacter sp. 19-2017]|uniref:MurR/RpiR family transcriptional regulator n=1 Tax=Pseudaminobacter soli (ex Zhang et al. 2022) TaxID=2831468 RepID=A0A942DUI6_9HYPH|nr:MurR/RpiR family transcriptional regulator [Pseudaminobacter soli]MBS3647184.1 MurR/RpiR family transcriptional regulator [Pseudaminobacter soli]
MDMIAISDLLLSHFNKLPPQLKFAASYVLEHPRDVALLSMRSQARSAGVSHSTMMRLAEWLGLEGYEALRVIYANNLRYLPETEGDVSPIQPPAYRARLMANHVAASLSQLDNQRSAEQQSAAAALLQDAREIWCVGSCLEKVVADCLAQTLAERELSAQSFDAGDESAVSQLRENRTGLALLAVGLHSGDCPTVRLATLASRSGAKVIAVTNYEKSALARIADETVLVEAPIPSTFPSMVPAIAAVEMIAARL